MMTKLLLGSVLSAAMIFVGFGNGGPTSSATSSGDGAISCCSAEVQEGEKVDCCKKTLACCDKGKTKACCVATARIGCCAKGMKCCETNSACCSAVQECCRNGAACCDEGKACCGKKAS